MTRNELDPRIKSKEKFAIMIGQGLADIRVVKVTTISVSETAFRWLGRFEVGDNRCKYDRILGFQLELFAIKICDLNDIFIEWNDF